jgi:hypothetical protein
MPIVPFSQWAPDKADIGNPGETVAQNVFPKSGGGYAPVPDLVEFSNALGARCQGAFAAKDSAAGVYNFAGDASKLYLLSDSSYSDVSKTAGYTTATDESWRFCQFGQKVYATNFNSTIQSFTLGTSSIFQDITGGAPKARHIATIDPGFVMVGNTNDSVDGAVPNRVWWSAFGDPDTWPTIGSALAQEDQSDFNDLPTGGWVQAVLGAVGGASAAIICESAVYRVDYEGPPAVFRFTCVDRSRGTPAPNSVINIGNFAAFLGDEDFYLFDGTQCIPIGDGRLAKTFYANLNQNYFDRVYGSVDPINKMLLWAYPSTSSQTGVADTIIAYNWSEKRWSTVSINLEFLYRGLSTSQTLEGLDSLGFTLDTLPFSLDSRAWTGGSIVLSAFTSNHKLGLFTGSNLEATLVTGEFENDGNFLYVQGVRPIVDGGTPTVSIGTRNTPQGSVSYTTATTPGDDGICPQHISARYARAKVIIPAGSSWSNAVGVQPYVQSEGGR